MQRRIARPWQPHLTILFMLALVMSALATPSASQADGFPVRSYTNPLRVIAPGIGNNLVESCADPSIFYEEEDGYWYTFCTKDPLNDDDVNANGEYIFRNMPILRSSDLVFWTYVGTVFDDTNFPDWVEPSAGLFAPAIEYFNDTYYLYYSITDTKLEPRNDDSAIGVATSDSPLGPWVDSGSPVVEPSARATIDPEVIEVDGQKYMFYGSYFGGISARTLSADGLTTDPASQVQITIDNRYEAPFIVQRNGYYYLFVSATDCCRGPLTGYSVFAGRSRNPLGPYVDREGVSLLEPRVGGTPVLSMNGNRWVGPGHNAVFQDFGGQWWTVYHAVDRDEPYYSRSPGFTKRPLLIDPVDWIGGWPTVRGGSWASDTRQPAPAAQPGQRSAYQTQRARPDRPGNLLPRFGDEFRGDELDERWSWVRQPDSDQYRVRNGAFRFDTQDGDLFIDSNTAPVLTRAAPRGDYVVETRVRLNMPLDKCPPDCRFIQAGLVIYGDDDNFVKLADVAIFNTRQTEFAKEVAPVPERYPRYGNTVVGPPNNWTWLRIVKRVEGDEELYTAYTSRDGETWVRGGTWTHQLGADARIGLVSMGGTGFTATFDYVRVSDVARQRQQSPRGGK